MGRRCERSVKFFGQDDSTTTAIYAKVDEASLISVMRSWPEGDER